MYFNNSFDPEFNVMPKEELKNAPIMVKPEKIRKYPEPGKPLQGDDLKDFIREMTFRIAKILGLEMK